MKKYQKSSLFWLLQVIIFIVFIQFTTTAQTIIFTSVIILSAIVYSLSTKRISFIYFVVITLATIFYFLFLAFIEHWSPAEQGKQILLHFTTMTVLFLLYISSYHLKDIVNENIELTNKMSELEKFIGNTKLLTQSEFENRAQIIKNSMQRRNETGYLISIDLSKVNSNISESILLDISISAIKSVRNQFDLVGQFSSNNIKILIQNTNEEGLNIVKNRFFSNFTEKIDEKIYDQLLIESVKI
ncbi:hypothetical protein [Gottfriedia solisilvae]|uniref:dGTP triphosphohydrolase n=1 Tax=Gottfriedia solisilvae TaxID=1516104 RepID=A0A8J3F281_9BACI|nr:hypothetical protein [Gottfriedia solisilvae]GGI17719.1 dGTP triphosphohydrolase [Gottfriedia solisilvae]